MTFLKAKREFEIRYYLWAKSEFEKEIEELFPNFRSFKTGSVWEMHQFMQQLHRDEQLALAHGLLTRFHLDAVKTLGESCSKAAKALLGRRDDFFRLRTNYQFLQDLEKNDQMEDAHALFQFIRTDMAHFVGETYLNDEKSLRSMFDAIFPTIPLSLEEQIAKRKRAGEKFKFTSQRKLLKIMAEKFQASFGGQCAESDRVLEGDPYLAFKMKCCGWILMTHFWFGRRESLINYNQSIASEMVVEQQGPNGTYLAGLRLASGISFSSWLGITSQIEWEYLTDEDVEPACDIVIKFCRHFFEVLPKLLKGLEYERITQEIQAG